ncbi:unnamed protein product, partial [Medioppia subpectinata]
MAVTYPQLSHGALQQILADQKVNRPVLQIIVYKQMSQSDQLKYRFQMSDGVETCSNFVIILPELIQRISKGEFEKFTVVELKAYTCTVNPGIGREIIVVSDMSVVMSGAKIGKRLDKQESNGGFLSNAGNTSLNGKPRAEPSKTASPMAAAKSGVSGPQSVCPISAITPYFNAWKIRARVTSKANKRNWSNARGEGCVFSFDCMDESTEIRVNAFTKECDKYYDLIEVNKVYYITKGTVKTANKKFSNLANDYEITLNSDSVVELCADIEVSEMPKIRYRFVQIKDLESVALQSVVDVLAVVKNVDECMSITSKKTQKELKKRDIALVDKTSYEVRFTLWNEVAEQFDGQTNQIIAIKNAVVGEFNGRTLSGVSSTTYQLDPDIPETNILKEWFEREGQTLSTNTLSKSYEGIRDNEWKFLSQINEQTVNGDNRSYFNIRARVVQTGRNPIYKACGQNGCLKKVTDNNNGFYHCAKCQTDSTQYEPRLVLSVALSDCTSEIWITLFQEQAEKILGISAKELHELQESNPPEFVKALTASEFKE